MNTEKRIFRIGAVITLMMAIVLSPIVSFAATSSAVIDFENGLSAGDFVTTLNVLSGITGDDLGWVTVEGFNPVYPSDNTAMIFDATCGGNILNCSGGDDDLYQPANGNVLIITEDMETTDPDDADVEGAQFEFDFSNWGPGTVTVDSIDVLDVEYEQGEGDAYILFNIGSPILIPNIGDSNIMTLDVNRSGVSWMIVLLNGSGAIDNIEISVEIPDGDEGCTPGYWKNHRDSWPDTGYDPDDPVSPTFDIPTELSDLADDTLMEALNYKGGPKAEGGARILLRAAVAALLNASSPDVDYPLTVGEVVSNVNSALASLDRGTMLTLAESLDGDNNLGCPID